MATTATSLRQRGYRVVSEGRLARGVLSGVDIAVATLADMAPARSFFFGSRRSSPPPGSPRR